MTRKRTSSEGIALVAKRLERDERADPREQAKVANARVEFLLRDATAIDLARVLGKHLSAPTVGTAFASNFFLGVPLDGAEPAINRVGGAIATLLSAPTQLEIRTQCSPAVGVPLHFEIYPFGYEKHQFSVTLQELRIDYELQAVVLRLISQGTGGRPGDPLLHQRVAPNTDEISFARYAQNGVFDSYLCRPALLAAVFATLVSSCYNQRVDPKNAESTRRDAIVDVVGETRVFASKCMQYAMRIVYDRHRNRQYPAVTDTLRRQALELSNCCAEPARFTPSSFLGAAGRFIAENEAERTSQ